MAKFEGIVGTRFAVQCPKECSKSAGHLYGNSIYTDDSSICLAAIHSELLTDRGG